MKMIAKFINFDILTWCKLIHLDHLNEGISALIKCRKSPLTILQIVDSKNNDTKFF